MVAVREPILASIPIRELRPTQITVGFREVEIMRKRWRARSSEKAAAYLGSHMIPVVLGPKKRHYIIDHHHLCRALLEEDQDAVLVTVIAKLCELDRHEFWFVLDNRGWMHPFDETGKRRRHSDIPKSVAELRDDPFRSLAGELRRIGGFAKDTSPFSEFLWAQFLRNKVDAKDMALDFKRALKTAFRLAKSLDAEYLPGWCGPVSEE